MNQEDLNQMISSESWIYDAHADETVTEQMARNIDSQNLWSAADSQALLDRTKGFKDLMVLYTCAMKTVRNKLDILNTEYNFRLQRNPIKTISTRLKQTGSLLDKMKKLHLEPTLDNIQENIFDVAGVRVICSYIDDIYTIADALLGQKDVTLVQKKDYIVHPKPNGYRSLHLIVSVPVYFSSQCVQVKAEVQIRTIAMDFWASLEHQLKYKKEIPDAQNVYNQLKNCADIIHATDERLLGIRRQLEQGEDIENCPLREDVLRSSLQLEIPDSILKN